MFIVLFTFVPLTSIQAATLTFEFDLSFGTTPAAGPAPWLTAVFDDEGSPGTVNLSLTVASTIGDADITEVYFNLDPVLDATDLTINRTGGTGPVSSKIVIDTGTDAFKADGDGLYDILFNLPPPGNRFEAGETLEFSITGIAALVVSDFNFISKPDGGAGPYLAAAKVQSTGNGSGSDWIAPPSAVIPVPASVWLFGSAIGLLGWMRRKAS
jgi:hypothetical protein